MPLITKHSLNFGSPLEKAMPRVLIACISILLVANLGAAAKTSPTGTCPVPAQLNTVITSPSTSACLSDLPGCLDAGFGSTSPGGGIAIVPLPGGGDSAVVQMSDGTLMEVGTGTYNSASTVALVHFKTDGTLDTSFGTGGISNVSLVPAMGAGDAVIDSADRIYIQGLAIPGGAAIVRFTTAGAVDTTFSSAGISILQTNFAPYALALQSDGKVLIAGTYQTGGPKHATVTEGAVVRLNSNGSLDTSFGSNGAALVPSIFKVFALAIEPTTAGNDILLGSWTTASSPGIVRLTPSGTIDSTFGNSGLATDSLCGFGGLPNYFGLDSKGNILFASSGPVVSGGPSVATVRRYTSNGQLDTTFGAPSSTGTGNTGIALLNFYGSNNRAHSLRMLPDDSFILSGNTSKAVSQYVSTSYEFLAKFDANGVLVPSFGSNGTVVVDVGDQNALDSGQGGSNLLIQTDGKIVAAPGDIHFASGPYSGQDFALFRLWP